jgi:hypothetical protein
MRVVLSPYHWFLLVIVLGLTWGAPLKAQETEQINFFVMMGHEVATGLEKFDRVLCQLTHGGEMTPYRTDTAGLLQFSVLKSGSSTLEVFVHPNEPLNFYFSFDPEGNMTVKGPAGEELPYYQRPDGTYYFVYNFNYIFIWDPADELGTILGYTEDRLGTFVPHPVHWGREIDWRLDYERRWLFCDPRLLSPGLIVTWQFPDGETLARYYPLDRTGFTDDQTWYQSFVTWTPGGLYWQLRRVFSTEFTRYLPNGGYLMTYQLENNDGSLSNQRVEEIIVDH